MWATPALRLLRKKFFRAYIGVVTTPLGKDVLSHNPHLDECFVIGSPLILSLIRLFPLLRSRRIGTVLLFHSSQRLILPFSTLLGASRIIGSEKSGKDLDFLLTDTIKAGEVHEIERRLLIVDYLNNLQDRDPDSTRMELFPSASELDYLHPITIGLHPGAKNIFKRWPSSHFIELGCQLQKATNGHIVVTGNLEERELVETIVKAIPGAKAVYENRSITAVASLLKKLSLYVTNDTGTLHVASAMGTPTIALFTPTNPLMCGPYFAPHVTVIQKKTTCFPCLGKKCQEPFCMLQISPSEVLKVGLKLLKEKQ